MLIDLPTIAFLRLDKSKRNRKYLIALSCRTLTYLNKSFDSRWLINVSKTFMEKKEFASNRLKFVDDDAHILIN